MSDWVPEFNDRVRAETDLGFPVYGWFRHLATGGHGAGKYAVVYCENKHVHRDVLLSSLTPFPKEDAAKPALFMAKFPKTGEWLSRDGAVIAATREEWATLSRVWADELVEVPAEVSTVPLFEGPLRELWDAHKASEQ